MKKIQASNLNELVDSVNQAFSVLLSNPVFQGIVGDTGSAGEDGGPGVRGSQWTFINLETLNTNYSTNHTQTTLTLSVLQQLIANSASNFISSTTLSTLVEGDLIINVDGIVYRWTGSTIGTTGINLVTPEQAVSYSTVTELIASSQSVNDGSSLQAQYELHEKRYKDSSPNNSLNDDAQYADGILDVQTVGAGAGFASPTTNLVGYVGTVSTSDNGNTRNNQTTISGHVLELHNLIQNNLIVNTNENVDILGQLISSHLPAHMILQNDLNTGLSLGHRTASSLKEFGQIWMSAPNVLSLSSSHTNDTHNHRLDLGLDLGGGVMGAKLSAPNIDINGVSKIFVNSQFVNSNRIVSTAADNSLETPYIVVDSYTSGNLPNYTLSDTLLTSNVLHNYLATRLHTIDDTDGLTTDSATQPPSVRAVRQLVTDATVQVDDTEGLTSDSPVQAPSVRAVRSLVSAASFGTDFIDVVSPSDPEPASPQSGWYVIPADTGTYTNFNNIVITDADKGWKSRFIYNGTAWELATLHVDPNNSLVYPFKQGVDISAVTGLGNFIYDLKLNIFDSSVDADLHIGEIYVNNTDSYAVRVYNSTDVLVAEFSVAASGYTPDDIEKIEFVEVGGSGITGNAVVRWSALTDNQSYTALQFDIDKTVITFTEALPDTVRRDEYRARLAWMEKVRHDGMRTIHVRKDGTGDYTNPYDACNAAGQIATIENKVEVLIHDDFEYYVAGDYFNGANVGVSPLVMLEMRSNVILRGVGGRRRLIAHLPNTHTDIEAYRRTQTINFSGGGEIHNLYIEAKNVRYPIHHDSPVGGADQPVRIVDCEIVHLGTDEVPELYRWTRPSAFGSGTGSGQTIELIRSEFRSPYFPVSNHSNIDFTKPNYFSVDNCKMINTRGGYALSIQVLGSGVREVYEVKNSQFIGSIEYTGDWYLAENRDEAYAMVANVKGCNNTPTFFDNQVDTNGRGRVLRITSNSTGNTSTVRVTGGTAKDDIFGNARFKDGGGVFAGVASGDICVYPNANGHAATAYGNSLGHRLGNCASVNKTLIVEIDGVERTVTFDQNYAGGSDKSTPASISDNDILTSISTQLVTGTADTFSVMGEYYHEFTDEVLHMANNSTTEEITVGMGLMRVSMNKVRKAVQGEIPDYVALDNIQVSGIANRLDDTGRVLRRGYLQVDDRFSFAWDGATPTFAEGETARIGATAGLWVKAADGVSAAWGETLELSEKWDEPRTEVVMRFNI